jgi:hypothetical protein
VVDASVKIRKVGYRSRKSTITMGPPTTSNKLEGVDASQSTGEKNGAKKGEVLKISQEVGSKIDDVEEKKKATSKAQGAQISSLTPKT